MKIRWNIAQLLTTRLRYACALRAAENARACAFVLPLQGEGERAARVNDRLDARVCTF
jgi:hypothetical protein